MILKKLAILGVAAVLTGCSSNEIVKEPIYIDKGVAYRVTDNKEVDGIMIGGERGYKEYTSYKDGRLANYKKTDWNEALVEERNYDSMGLLDGKVRNGENYSNYSHGRLMGEYKESYYGETLRYYRDGVLHSKQDVKGEIRYYNDGLESEIDPGPGRVASVKAVWGREPKRKYTGELYSEPVYKELVPRYGGVLEIKRYDKGILKYVKYYSKEGVKTGETHFYDGDTDRKSKVFEYVNGYLNEYYSYNPQGELEGEVIDRRSIDQILTKNYISNIPHGRVKNSNVKNGRISQEGVYNMGVFSGEKDGRYYSQGIEVEKTDTVEIEPLEILEKPEGELSFTGLTRRDNRDELLIDEYVSGKVVKTYSYRKNILEKITTFSDDGRYREESYKEGVLTNVFNYSSNGSRNGEFMRIEHSNSKTVGSIVDNRIEGKSIHYHRGEIYYIDDYKDGSSYERTTYFDYEKGRISEVSRGKFHSKSGQWIVVGESYIYFEDGNIKEKREYGDEITSEKKVNYTEYYESGIVKSTYTRDYCDCRYIGEMTEYSQEGNISSKTLYSEKGELVNKKEYDKKGKEIRDISYDEYGREIKEL